MAEAAPLDSFQFVPERSQESLDFLQNWFLDLSTPRLVRVWQDKLRLYDVNGRFVQLSGIGYQEEAIVPMLDGIHAAYNPDTIHRPIELPYKEFKTGRRHPWAQGPA